MIIKEINITNFGKFKDKTINFEKGMNIVYGENEAGKTTIHTFIRGMLFGIEKTRGRISDNDAYTKYEPWDNPALYAGSMIIDVGGTNYRIERNFNKDNKSVTIVNIDEGRELAKEEIDKLFDGFDENCYYNTISVSQLGGATDKELELILKNYAANLGSAKTTELNVKSAMEKLTNKRKEIRNSFAGESEGALKANLRDMTSEMEELLNAENAMEKNVLRNKDRLYVANDKYNRLKTSQNQYDEDALVKKGQLDVLKSQHNTIQSEIDTLRSERETLKDKRYELMEKLDDIDVRDSDEIDELVKRIRKQKSLPNLFAVACMVFSLVGAIIFFVSYAIDYVIPMPYGFDMYLVFGSICAGIFVISLIACIGSILKKSGKKNAEIKRLNELRGTVDEISKLKNAIEANEERMEKMSKQLRDVNKDINEQDEQKVETVDNTKEIESIKKEMDELKDLISKDEWTLEHNREKYEELSVDKNLLLERLERLKVNMREADAASLALSTIEDIAKEVRDNFGNKLNEEASRYMNSITEGKYDKIVIDDKLNISINSTGKLLKSSHLSKGTLEQIYLSLRLAAANILFADDSKPILMDDAFAMYDNKRMGRALEFLDENLDQVIIFSCHTREKVMADKLNINYNLIKLN